MLGRVPLLGPEQLPRGMSLAVGRILRSCNAPLPFSVWVCASIETARAEALRRRGICPGEPRTGRILMFSPYHAGGLQHEHLYQYAAAAFVDEIDWVLSGDAGAPSRQALASHIALSCWRLGCRVHPLEWEPSHIPEGGADGLGPVLCGDSSCSVSTAKPISDVEILVSLASWVMGAAGWRKKISKIHVSYRGLFSFQDQARSARQWFQRFQYSAKYCYIETSWLLFICQHLGLFRSLKPVTQRPFAFWLPFGAMTRGPRRFRFATHQHRLTSDF